MKAPNISPVFKYELMNVLRGKWILGYVLLLLGFSEALLQFSSESAKAVASLMSLVLLIIPMVSILYSSMYWYNNEGFTTLLMTQPTGRAQIYLNRWLAISFALGLAYLGGVGIPLTFEGLLGSPAILLLTLGFLLSFIFVGLGLLTAVLVSDRMKGIGIAFTFWFYFSVVHDGIVFAFVSAFRDYPMEIPSMFLTGVNPIDLTRFTMLMGMDLSALLGYTGTVLQKTLSGPTGVILVCAALALWVALPVGLGIRLFRKRNF